MPKIAIIGSGISGLTLAHELSHYTDVEVFEKAKGVGGRLATRYAGDFEFDHGAQYFTVHNPLFQSFVDELLHHRLVDVWKPRFVEFSHNKIIQKKRWDADYPHYVAVPRMNAIAKYLAKDLRVNLKTQIESLEKIDDQWLLVASDMQKYGPFDWVLSTAPWPQTRQIFPQYFDMDVNPMSACYALMLGFTKPLHLDWDVALIKNSILSWISVNSTKPGRPKSDSLLVLSSNQWADENIEAERDWVIGQMLKQLHDYIDVSPMHIDLHRWRYANAPKQENITIFMDKELCLGACGDWSIHGRVESAYLAAQALFEQIKSNILMK